jgi:hypothetical protein
MDRRNYLYLNLWGVYNGTSTETTDRDVGIGTRICVSDVVVSSPLPFEIVSIKEDV